jgi:hypothetical protein
LVVSLQAAAIARVRRRRERLVDAMEVSIQSDCRLRRLNAFAEAVTSLHRSHGLG